MMFDIKREEATVLARLEEIKAAKAKWQAEAEACRKVAEEAAQREAAEEAAHQKAAEEAVAVSGSQLAVGDVERGMADWAQQRRMSRSLPPLCKSGGITEVRNLLIMVFVENLVTAAERKAWPASLQWAPTSGRAPPAGGRAPHARG